MIPTLEEVKAFVKESNAIERIFREPTQEELNEFIRFIQLPKVDISQLEHFVTIYEPKAKLRDQYGMNVRIGSYFPPFGAPEMRYNLENLLNQDYNAHKLHLEYEKIHPFTDCNGRSGRALWAWKMGDLTGGFLLNFYYHALQFYTKEY